MLECVDCIDADSGEDIASALESLVAPADAGAVMDEADNVDALTNANSYLQSLVNSGELGGSKRKDVMKRLAGVAKKGLRTIIKQMTKLAKAERKTLNMGDGLGCVIQGVDPKNTTSIVDTDNFNVKIPQLAGVLAKAVASV